MRTETFDFIPTELHASGPVGEIIVHTNLEARNAAVTLEPMTPGDEEAQKEIAKAIVKREGSRLIVKLPEDSGGTTVVHSGGGGISVSGGGMIISSGRGVTMVNGRVISGNGVVQIGSGGIRAIIYVSTAIEAVLRTRAGEIQVYGDLAKLSAEASSGSIRALGIITEAACVPAPAASTRTPRRPTSGPGPAPAASASPPPPACTSTRTTSPSPAAAAA
jgi:hypothetical protein